MSLEVEQLERRYASCCALTDVSFSVPAGDLVGLIGPNGSGKTSLLRILSTFLPPTRGRARVAGFDCRTQVDAVRRRIGYLPEQLLAEPVARVDEYLDHRARLKQIDRRRRASEVDRCLAACDLSDVRRRQIIRLSQGFRRRIGLADALLGDPAVLLLDEPTVGLDPLQVRRTRELLLSLAGRTTILISTHLLAEAELVCRRALVLLHGRLVSDVNLADLRLGAGVELELTASADQVGTSLRSLPGVTEARLLHDGPAASRWRLQGGAEFRREDVAVLCVGRGWGVRELRSTAESLEEHLAQLVVRPWGEAP